MLKNLNKMKKLFVIALFVSSTLGLASAKESAETIFNAASTISAPASTEKKLSKSEMKAMVLRLKEIKAMDKSQFTRDQKHSLRKEVKDIGDQLNKQDGVYLYLSGTAILIIILLIILL